MKNSENVSFYLYLGSDSVGHNTSLHTIIFGDFSLQSTILFYVTFATSIISASLGLAKCLLYGVARTISADGFLDGLLSGRFLIASLASGFILISRAVIFALHILVNTREQSVQVHGGEIRQ